MSNKRNKDKLELAAKIASSSDHVQHTYESIELSIMRVLRWLSSLVDRVLFNQKYSKLTAFLLAVLLYFFVNVSESKMIITQSGYNFENIPLTVNVDGSVYEVSGLPSNVSVSVIGDVSDISMLKNSDTYKVVADLTGLGEGTHEVDLLARDFSNKLSVSVNPSKAIVTIRKKVTRTFALSYDFVNTNNLDKIYVLGNPVLSATEVMVRASEETLNKIAFVKALIDVSNQTGSFTTEATLVAYDSMGEKVGVNIIPSVINVDVPVSSPSKDVPVIIKPVGNLPNGLSIDTISLDHSSVTIYGPTSVINTINEISVDIDASTLIENASYTAPIITPTGINKLSVQRVVMQVTLDERTSRQIDNIPINVYKNKEGYRFSLAEGEDVVASVIVRGTQKNVDAVSVEDLDVYIDASQVSEGTREMVLFVSGNSTLLEYELVKPTLIMEVSK